MSPGFTWSRWSSLSGVARSGWSSRIHQRGGADPGSDEAYASPSSCTTTVVDLSSRGRGATGSRIHAVVLVEEPNRSLVDCPSSTRGRTPVRRPTPRRSRRRRAALAFGSSAGGGAPSSPEPAFLLAADATESRRLPSRAEVRAVATATPPARRPPVTRTAVETSRRRWLRWAEWDGSPPCSVIPFLDGTRWLL